jgi:hypothetical protein
LFEATSNGAVNVYSSRNMGRDRKLFEEIMSKYFIDR